jgi:glutathione S-transferase
MGLQDDPENPAAVAARSGAVGYYDELEGLLVDQDYLAGDYSFADIAFYMAQLFGARMGAPMTGATPTLLRWRDRLTMRPMVMAVVRPMASFLASRGRPVPDFLAGAVQQ